MYPVQTYQKEIINDNMESKYKFIELMVKGYEQYGEVPQFEVKF